VLGDVMGKKWGAWYFSFGFLSYIRAAVRICISEGNFSTKSILQKINDVVYHDPVVNDVLSSLSLVMLDATGICNNLFRCRRSAIALLQ
jgi:sigma-B regulation protein RsbU (phosphoserine phosphatase)